MMKSFSMTLMALVLVLGFSSCQDKADKDKDKKDRTFQGKAGKLASEGCDLICNLLDAIEEDDHDAVVEA